MQSIHIREEESLPGVAVLFIDGEVDLRTAPDLRLALTRLLADGKFTIILDLGEVPYLDSAALGVLVEAVRRAREQNGAIHLVRLTAFVRRAFEITRLFRIFEIHETVENAVAAIAAAPRYPSSFAGPGTTSEGSPANLQAPSAPDKS